jgi:spectinomycin phosphotransferase
MDMIAALHQSAAVVQDRAPGHVPSYSARDELDAFLIDPARPWDGGPYSEAAHRLLRANAADLAELAAGFDRLADSTAPARAHPVITHGEPHQANVMLVRGRLMLIDWDTVAMAAPERDVWQIVTTSNATTSNATTDNEGIKRYEQATGRVLDRTVIALYRMRWYLDDLAQAIRLFRNQHGDTADTRLFWDDLAPQLEELPARLGRLESTGQ